MKKTKKQENCSKLLMIFSMSIAMLTGVLAMGIGSIKDTYKSARAVEYADDEYIELSVVELNNYSFNNLANLFNNNSNISLVQAIYLSYTNFYRYDSIEYNSYVSYGYNDDNYTIDLNLESGANYGRFSHEDYGTFNNYIRIYTDDTTSENYQLIKQAIEQDIAANQSHDDNIGGALQQFVQILVNGIGDLARGVADGISTMAKSLFLQVNASTGAVEGLSVFGGIVAIFAGLALAVGITTKVYTWITSLGN